jgi:hypothetical protein
MAKNRKEAEKLLLSLIEEIEGGTVNSSLYKTLFEGMSDTEFDSFVSQVEAKEVHISIIVPNTSKIVLDVERSMKVGEKLGVKFFQRLILTDPLTGVETKTPMEYLVMHMPVRRQSQHLIKKQSIPKSSKVIDHLSGQVTGDSKGGKISLPELLVMESKDLTDNLLELIKVRGGDDKAYKGMLEQIEATGSFSIAPLLELNSKPTSTETLMAYLLAGHLSNTMGKQ